MEYEIENEYLKVGLSDQGGELQYIKGKNSELDFLWNGRPRWKLSAPTLFPIIGKLKHDRCKIDNKSYKIYQHGFASNMIHTMIEKSKQKIEFELMYNEKTLKSYPFKYSFKTIYSIDRNIINVEFLVKNIDDKDIYFSLGSHPTFRLPFNENDEIEDYYLEFEKEEDTSILKINKDDFIIGRTENYLKGRTIKITDKLFKNGTLIFDRLKSGNVSLKSKINDNYITINLGNFPILAMWSIEKTRPFICIEPWFGHADLQDFDGEFKDKQGIIKLSCNKEFRGNYSIEIG